MIIFLHNYIIIIMLKIHVYCVCTAYYQRMYINTDVYSVHTCIQMSIFVH